MSIIYDFAMEIGLVSIFFPGFFVSKEECKFTTFMLSLDEHIHVLYLRTILCTSNEVHVRSLLAELA